MVLSLSVLGLGPVLPTQRAYGYGDGFGGTGMGGGLPMGFGMGGQTGMTPSDGSFGLAQSQQSLSDVDLMTGAMLGDSVLDYVNGDQTVVTDLYNADQLAIDAKRLANQAKAAAEAKQRAAAKASAVGGQAEVGPEGCPTSAPASAVKGSVDVYELCMKSVAQARNPNAAKAIKFAMAQLGRPYCKPGSRAAEAPCNGDTNRFGKGPSRAFDCSGLMFSAFESAGVTLGGTVSQNQPINAPSRRIDASEAMPGDLIQMNDGGHIALGLSDEWTVGASNWNVGVVLSKRSNVTFAGAVG